jgi:integrase
MSIRQIGNNWQIDYYANGRRVRERVGSSRQLADIVLKKRLVAIAEGRFLDIKKRERVKFEDFADKYLKEHSESKKSYYTDIKIVGLLKKVFGGKCLHEITALEIQEFKVKRAAEVSPATVNRALAVLKSMFNRAIEWDKATENPCKRVKMLKENNKRLRFLEKEEIGRLLGAIDELMLINKHDQYIHLKPIIIVALNTGMRKGEILGLKWRDIDIQRKTIHLSDTKNGDDRYVPMNDIVIKTIIAVPKNKDSAYIFCNQRGEPYGDIKKSYLSAVKKAGIIDFHFHDLRHTFASQLVMAGVDLNTVRDLLGHKSLEMTLRYSHLSPEHKQRAVDVLAQRMVTNWSQAPVAEEVDRSSTFVTV